MKKIAVTGGLSCGKTTVCHIFQQLGAFVINSDSIVHELLDPKTPLGNKIIYLLGDSVLQGSQFNKQKIASIIFDNPKLLKKYEELIHPKVLEKIKSLEILANEQHEKLFVVEIPLLFESKMEFFFDTIITVSATMDVCRNRFIKKHNALASSFNIRYSTQLPLSEKERKAKFVIKNNGTKQELESKIRKILNEI